MGHTIQFRNLGTSSIAQERMKILYSNLVGLYRWSVGRWCPRIINWPLSGRGLGDVAQFRNFGTPQYFANG